MIPYILECIAFQLVFLIIYDFILKRETFFQWNRVYLIGTYALSLLLPWIKIEAFKTEVPTAFNGYSEFLWNLNQQVVTVEPETTDVFQVSWQQGIFICGVLLATVFFVIKVWHLYQLKRKGTTSYFKNFTQILVPESSIAFSFFKSIFLGDKLAEKERPVIISHELVHIGQWHSIDLLFFELMRILSWFNPLVYVYQSRVSELHEFIADAQVPKNEREAHYDLLLSQIFQTRNISFINQFFKKSLIKKRIVMLQKTKSKKVWQLKYMLLVPIIFGMLLYTSCELGSKSEEDIILPTSTELNTQIDVPFAIIDKVPIFPGCENVEDQRACFNEKIQKHISKNFNYPQEAQELGIEGRVSVMFWIRKDGTIGNIKMRGPDKLLEDEVERIIKRLPVMIPGKQKGENVNVPFSIPISFKLTNEEEGKAGEKEDNIERGVPFAMIDQVPVFPGCENSDDQRTCFNAHIQKHISKNFNYPQEAQEAGIEGRVYVMFMIMEDGTIDNIRLRGPDKLLEDEVERIIKKLPNMIPGEHDGKVISVPYTIPVNFKLQ